VCVCVCVCVCVVCVCVCVCVGVGVVACCTGQVSLYHDFSGFCVRAHACIHIDARIDVHVYVCVSVCL
jgi:hypothetical protein